MLLLEIFKFKLFIKKNTISRYGIDPQVKLFFFTPITDVGHVPVLVLHNRPSTL